MTAFHHKGHQHEPFPDTVQYTCGGVSGQEKLRYDTAPLAAFDRQLWEAGARIGLPVWPQDLSLFLDRA